jgi:hypothetical protein
MSLGSRWIVKRVWGKSEEIVKTHADGCAKGLTGKTANLVPGKKNRNGGG